MTDIVHPAIEQARPIAEPAVRRQRARLQQDAPQQEVQQRAPRDAVTLDDVIADFVQLRFQNVRVMNALSASHGIAPGDLRALFFIRGNREVTPKRLADHLGLTMGAMTTLLDRIERAGLARRTPHPTDRRSLLLEITEQGRAAVAADGEHYRAAFAASVPEQHLPIAHQLLAELAEQLRRIADAHEPPAR